MLRFVVLYFVRRTLTAPLPSAEGSEHVSFIKDPDGRGTISLVMSCLLTLLLCVWQALHLNVPRRGETAWEKIVTNILWITVGIYAPELVVFTAWRQWSSSKLLSKVVEDQLKKEEGSDKSEDGVNNGLQSQGIKRKSEKENVLTIDTKQHAHRRRKHKWSATHSFFACTGGFAFEVDDNRLGTKDTSSQFLSPDCPKRLTLTARGVALLAQCGLLPDIPEEEIRDKSKANNLAKALVVLQACWMLVQVIARLVEHLPVTLLEVNTVAHVLCAFLMYAMWWNKPLLPEEPVILKGDWVESLCAYMYMSSELSGKVENAKVDSQTVIRRLFASLKVYSKVPEFERLRILVANTTASGDSSDPSDNNAEGTSQDAPGGLIGILSLFEPCPQTCLDELQVIREREKTSETAFFERRPRIAPSNRKPTLASHIHIRRWTLASEAMQNHAVLRSSSYILHSHTTHDTETPYPMPNQDLPTHTCLHPKPTELIKEYIQNWPYDDLLRNVGGLTVGIVLWLSNFIYGGLHASAWNEYFPSSAEKWLWRASCSYISFAGGLWIVLNWVAAAYPPLNEFWEGWMDGKKGWFWGAVLGILVGVCGISFGVTRVYLVAEAFVSLRSTVKGVYDTPDWTQLVPHF